MTHSDRPMESNNPPDKDAAGDVSTTGHSDREADHTDTVRATGTTAGHPSHGADSHGAHGHGHDDDLDDEHDGHGGHGDDNSEVPTLVPTTWRQLIFPALILLLVAILVWGPVSAAFQSRPISPATPTEKHGKEGSTEEHGTTKGEPTHKAEPGATEETHSPGEVTPTAVPNSQQRTAPDPAVVATQTAVGIAAAEGTVARAPVQLQFGGQEFVVKGGSNLLPDWQPPQDQGIATWIEGTYANHILYLPYSEQNETLFKSSEKGETLKLVMNTGQVFEFEVTRSERALNGPSTDRAQFTVTTAMAQDHAGITLFLIGDPAQDRAVVQADFNGHIE